MITVLAEPGSLERGRTIRLAASEAHHLRVRRAQPGDPVRLLDGHGSVAEGVLTGPADDGAIAVGEVAGVARPATLGLAVGAGDRDRFLWLAEKCAELGVTDLVPLETERTAGVGNRVRGPYVDKLQRRGLEAIKQSGAAWAPVVHLPHQLAELVARHRGGRRWLADGAGQAAGRVMPQEDVWVAVGPEGGFTEAERALLIGEGWVPVRLGERVLRFETAAIAAAVSVGMFRIG